MKFFTLLLLSSLSVALVLAYPSNPDEVTDLQTKVDNNGAAPDSDLNSQTELNREPRYLLKKLLKKVQPYPYYTNSWPIYSSGRRYAAGGLSVNYGYTKVIG